MKQKTFILSVAGALGLALCGWWLWPSSDDRPKKADGKVLRVKGARKVTDAAKRGSEVRIGKGGKNRPKAFKPAESSKDFDINAVSDMSSGFLDDEDELLAETSSVVKQIYREMLGSLSKFNRKETRLAVQRLLAAIAKGEQVPRFMKIKAIEALKMCGDGCSSLAELLGLAADVDPVVASASLDALQEVLWDFEAQPQQLASAITMAIGMTTDRSIIESFVFEMNDLPVALKVSTALSIIDSGNVTAVELLEENRSFIFDDFNGNINSREDIIRYGERNGVDSDGDAVGEVAGEGTEADGQSGGVAQQQ